MDGVNLDPYSLMVIQTNLEIMDEIEIDDVDFGPVGEIELDVVQIRSIVNSLH